MVTRLDHLNVEEQIIILGQAFNFFELRKKEIYDLAKEETLSVEPGNIDLYYPENWKSSNWRWFLEKHHLLD